MSPVRAALALALLVCAMFLVEPSAGQVIGIDFGSDFIKVALVKPRSAINIVLDEQSKRKSAAIVGFDETERLFGNAATQLAIRKPDAVYALMVNTLGRTVESAQVQQLVQEFKLPYKLFTNDRGSVSVHHLKTDVNYSAEELVAMTLEYLKKISETEAGLPVLDCVISVPPYWTFKQRKAMLDAAQVAGLNVLSLINENTAAALHYGLDREYNVSRQDSFIFYNMGSTSTKVSYAVYSGYPHPSKKNASVGHIEIKGTSSDDMLGGLSFDLRLMNRFATDFQQQLNKKMNGKAPDVTTIPRTMGKLRAQARKVKEVLSANTEVPVYIESAYQDYDYRTVVTRDEFNKLTADLVERAVTPLQQLFDKLQLTPAQITALVPIGGGTRVPSVQQKLKDFMGADKLAFNINADEAMALGAAFRAANMSAHVRVRPVGLVDMSPHAVGVRFSELPGSTFAQAAAGEEETAATSSETEASEDSASGEGETDDSATAKKAKSASGSENKPFTKRATVFSANSRLDKRRVVSFGHTRDFHVSMHYDDAQSLPAGVSPVFALFNVTGLTALMNDPANAALLRSKPPKKDAPSEDTAAEGEAEDNTLQTPKISLSFVLDSSSLVDLVKAEATLDEYVRVEVPKKVKEEKKSKSKKDKGDAKSDAKGEGEAAEKKDDEDKKTDAAEGEATKDAKDAKEEVKEEKEWVVRKRTRTFPLSISRGGADIRPMTLPDRVAAKAVLRALREKDESRRKIAAARNNLETLIYAVRGKLGDEETEKVSQEADRNTLSELLSATETWLYDQADDGAAKFIDKQKEINKLWTPIQLRVAELHARPEALNATEALIVHARDALVKLRDERPWVPEEKREKLATMLDEAAKWIDTKKAEQEALPLYEPPVLLSEELFARVRPVAEYMEQLLRIKKPKPKPKPANATADANSTATPTSTATPSEESAPESQGEGGSSSTGEGGANESGDNEQKPEDTGSADTDSDAGAGAGAEQSRGEGAAADDEDDSATKDEL